jgi:hypothetical protein
MSADENPKSTEVRVPLRESYDSRPTPPFPPPVRSYDSVPTPAPAPPQPANVPCEPGPAQGSYDSVPTPPPPPPTKK